MTIAIKDLSVVFISYDEPRRDEYWADLVKKCPWAKRVHGVTGIDSAHKAAAKVADTEHFITVDADNVVDREFFDIFIKEEFLGATSIVTWPARNSVNGLTYANGGVKCWPRKLALEMRTHENAPSDAISIDFKPDVSTAEPDQWFNIWDPHPYSTCHLNGSAFQAFRSGFREAAKLSLLCGLSIRPSISEEYERLERDIQRPHHPPDILRHRLLVWCTVGADAPNGQWTIYGARLGCRMAAEPNWDIALLNDYSWFEQRWSKDFADLDQGNDPNRIESEIRRLGARLRDDLGLPVAELTAKQSQFFKGLYVSPVDANALVVLGDRYRLGRGLPKNSGKALTHYRTAAAHGSSNAINNIGQMIRLGEGVSKDVKQGIDLLERASAMGNAFAPYNLGRMYRIGWGVDRDSKRAARDFQLACGRGHPQAFIELGEMFESGEGVTRNNEKAYTLFLVAQQLGSPTAKDHLKPLNDKLSIRQKGRLRRQAKVQKQSLGRVGLSVARSPAAPRSTTEITGRPAG